jgi:hypothetical protein
VPDAETKPKLAFSVSVTMVVPVAGAEPTLLTAIMKTPLVPAVKLPVWDFVMERSGAVLGVTVTVSVEVAVGEPVVAAVAVFMMLAGAVKATAVVRVMLPAAADAAIGPGFVQVTT